MKKGLFFLFLFIPAFFYSEELLIKDCFSIELPESFKDVSQGSVIAYSSDNYQILSSIFSVENSTLDDFAKFRFDFIKKSKPLFKEERTEDNFISKYHTYVILKEYTEKIANNIESYYINCCFKSNDKFVSLMFIIDKKYYLKNKDEVYKVLESIKEKK
jgi:hypothetical protein